MKYRESHRNSSSSLCVKSSRIASYGIAVASSRAVAVAIVAVTSAACKLERRENEVLGDKMVNSNKKGRLDGANELNEMKN